MRITGVLLPLVLLATLLLVAAPVAAQLPPLPSGVVEVNESRLVVRVYPDGCIGYTYLASGVVRLMGGAQSTPSIVYVVDENVTKTTLLMNLSISVAGVEGRGSVGIEASGEYVLDAGLSARGSVALRSEGKELRGSFELRLASDKGEASLVVEPGEKACDALRSIASRFSFISVEECRVEGEAARAKLVVDMGALWKTLYREGLSATDVASLSRLLEARYGVRGSFQLRLSTSNGVKLSFTIDGEGDVAKLYSDLQAAYPAITRLILVLASRYASQLGVSKSLPIAAVAIPESPLLDKPPFHNRYVMKLEPRDGELEVLVEVNVGHACYAAASGSPERDARMALRSLAEVITSMRTVLGLLDQRLHGVTRLVPNEVIVEGVDGVRVQPERVKPEKLGEVSIIVERGAGTRTPVQGGVVETATRTPPATQAGGATGKPAATTTPLTATRTGAPGGAELVGIVAAAVALGALAGYLARRR